jgi:hypothetical protein
MHAARKRKAHDAGVINDDYDDGQRTQKIETGLAFTIGKARINGCFGCGLVNAGNRSRQLLTVESAISAGQTFPQKYPFKLRFPSIDWHRPCSK